MPIHENEFQSVPMMGNVIGVPVEGDLASVSVQIQRITATDAEMDDILMSLVDHLQAWPGRAELGNVLAQKYVTGFYPATPTNPVGQGVEEPEPDPDPDNAPAPAPA